MIHNALEKRGKIFGVNTYFESKSFNSLKIDAIHYMIIYFKDKKLKKRLHVLEADMITINKKNIDLMSLALQMRVQHERHCACLSYKSR